jgi:hypothetical protein
MKVNFIFLKKNLAKQTAGAGLGAWNEKKTPSNNRTKELLSAEPKVVVTPTKTRLASFF